MVRGDDARDRQHPRVTMLSTPPSGSSLNMVEIFFGIFTRCGIFASVKDLIAAIETFIDGWNVRCQAFVWTKPPTKYSPRLTVKRLQTHDNTGSGRTHVPSHLTGSRPWRST